MTQDEWAKLFALNDRLTQLYAAIQNDVYAVEKLSGLSMNEAQDALEQFAFAMTKANDIMNQRLEEDRQEHFRKQEVEEVISQTAMKLRLERIKKDVEKTKNERVRKTRPKAFGSGEESVQ